MCISGELVMSWDPTSMTVIILASSPFAVSTFRAASLCLYQYGVIPSHGIVVGVVWIRVFVGG
jgi:hypothetical protein